MTVLRACLTALTMLSAAEVAAQEQVVPVAQSAPAAGAAAPATIDRVITLADLGYGNGLEFRQLTGSARIFVPLPDQAPLRGGTLQLQLSHGATLAGDRFLQVRIGDRVTSQPLEGLSGEIDLQLDFDRSDISNGFLVIDLTYSGAVSDRVCIDDRASGDFLTIDASSAVTLQLAPAAVASARSFAALRPQETRVVLEGGDTLAGLAAATRAAVLFGAEAGRLQFGAGDATDAPGLWSEGLVTIAPTSSGVAAEMSVEAAEGAPALRLRGSDPQLGLWQLASEWSGLASGADTVTRALSASAAAEDRLMLSALGADLSSREVVGSSEVLIPFGIDDLMPGKTVSAVDLHLAAALDPAGRGATASVFLNDTLLGNRPLDSGAPERLLFPVPEGLIGRDNLLRVVIQRQPEGGECRFRPQGYPAQVLPGSALQLSDRGGEVEDFFALRQAFGQGAQLVLDPALGLDVASALPWLAGVADTLIPDRAPIVPRSSVAALEPGLPFIVVSDSDPGEGTPVISFDQGRVQIRDTAGEVVFEGEELAALGVVQMVTRNDLPGIWLRPGAGPAPALSPERPLLLDRGDLALLGEEGVILATSTDRAPLIEVSYPDRQSIAQLLAKYRPWIVGGLWIVLTLIVLGIFQRVYRARRAPSGS